MKKMIVFLLALTLLLTACGPADTPETKASQTQASQTQPPQTQAPTTEPSATTEPAAPAVSTTGPATDTQGPDPELIAKAESCIGKTVEDLYALIGEPISSDYAPSCLGPGEDGNLYYDGFTVYTYREDGVETVRVVE